MNHTVRAFFCTAIRLLISFAPAGNTGGCSRGILLFYCISGSLFNYIPASFRFPQPAQFTGRHQEV